MKIKFVKDYKAFMGVENPFDGRYDYRIGEIRAANDEPAQWLIDNGFAEEVEEDYLFEEITHYAQGDKVAVEIWFRKDKDGGRPKEMVDFGKFMGAINIVSQDEGFMTRQSDGMGWAIYLRDNGQLDITSTYHELAGAFCFAWNDDAKASIKKHPDEWKTITKYKWGKE